MAVPRTGRFRFELVERDRTPDHQPNHNISLWIKPLNLSAPIWVSEATQRPVFHSLSRETSAIMPEGGLRLNWNINAPPASPFSISTVRCTRARPASACLRTSVSPEMCLDFNQKPSGGFFYWSSSLLASFWRSFSEISSLSR